MLIQSLKHHFPARLPEWQNAGWLTCWGVYVSLHPGMFTDPETSGIFSGMAALVAWTGMAPAGVWGVCAILVGMVRAAALFINGAYARTPIVRLIASAISAFVISQIVIGLVRSGVPNTGVVTYFWLFLADIASAYRASSDIPVAEANRLKTGDRRRHVGGH
jgi:hypothetical protein